MQVKNKSDASRLLIHRHQNTDLLNIAVTVYLSNIMLWTVVVILAILWLLGMVTSYTMGGLLHILLVVALVIIVVNLIRGRRPVI